MNELEIILAVAIPIGAALGAIVGRRGGRDWEESPPQRYTDDVDAIKECIHEAKGLIREQGRLTRDQFAHHDGKDEQRQTHTLERLAALDSQLAALEVKIKCGPQ